MDKEKIKNEMICRLAGVMSGLVLAATNIFSILAPVQLVALIPVFYIGIKRENSYSKVMNAGIYMGLFYIFPQMILLRMPIPITLVLLLLFIIIMISLVMGSAWLLRRSSGLWTCIAVGAFLVVLDWVNFTLVPLWGTAQSIVRPWSAYPSLIQFTSITGITGIIFIVGTLQAVFVCAIVNANMRKKLTFAALSIVLILAGMNLFILGQKPIGKMKVAAIGWETKAFKNVEYAQTNEGFDKLFAEPAIKAANEGAKLIVSPEMGFYIDKYTRDEWREKFQRIATDCNVVLAVGYFDSSEKQNRLMYVVPSSEILPEYSKTYLIPIFEDYLKGDGTLRTLDVNGISLGGMICQDDNFTRFSREYGRKKVSIVAVPTLDWKTVKDGHLQNSIHRTIESRYAVVRAAMNGISAIIAPGGKVLARYDHFKKGANVIIADVPVYKSATMFSRFGHWPVGIAIIFLAGYLIQTLNRKPQINVNENELKMDSRPSTCAGMTKRTNK